MIPDVEWLAFLPAAVLLAATPGANQLLVLRNGVRHGPRPAIHASLGRFAAFALMVLAVAAGLGAVLATSERVFTLVKWCGVAYLSWLGCRSLFTAVRGTRFTAVRGTRPTAVRGAHRSGTELTATPGKPGGMGSWKLARQEFVVAASNPKALLLFTVFLPQFLTDGAPHVAPPLLALGVAYIAVEFCCACGYAAIGARLKRLGLTRRAQRLLDAGTGLAMLALAGRLGAQKR
ncbi:LysE family translocator [Streptomyces iconiensis]|uniref:LysE family translocator n=1 Tax=Streptomyces iconiensis TaxID=1384038 RepID=A0ABT7A9R6_9ACTN|nr:LysE family translocator [Streptomyces iconiensis]MDJ1137546.1 LysE family translocator [Streptomyces iconiensis]